MLWLIGFNHSTTILDHGCWSKRLQMDEALIKMAGQIHNIQIITDY
jgi:hypothetical protein